MPRATRSFLPAIPLHIVQRGNNRSACFFLNRDYSLFLQKLKENADRFSVDIHSYVLMTNHFHLLVSPSTTDGVCKMMQCLGTSYVKHVNRSYSRTGSLWKGRYKASFVDSEPYFMILSRYIELNPVRACMVEHPAEYQWSSFRTNGTGAPNSLVKQHPLYLSLGSNDTQRQENYRELFKPEIPEYTLEQIRNACNKSWVLGDDRFKKQIEAQLGRALLPFPRGGDRKSGKTKND
jgi:putative transposase